MKQLLLGIILLTSIQALECECPIQLNKEWQLESQEISKEETTKNTYETKSSGVVSKEEAKKMITQIKDMYPINEEKKEIIKSEKEEKIKKTILCSESITVLPNGIEWINFEKNKYKTNKYKIRTQLTTKEINCLYFKGNESLFKTPEGWEDDPELYYENKCADEKMGSQEKCIENNGIISERFQNGCKEKICYVCQKEDEDYNELLEYEIIAFEWGMEKDLLEKCRDEDGKVEIRRETCKETYRCVKEKR